LALTTRLGRRRWPLVTAAVTGYLSLLAVRQLMAVEPSHQAFRDCDRCPELVEIPAGSYTMGSSARERRVLGVPALFNRMESPRHRVTIPRPLAVGRYSVTFAEWDACVSDGGCNGYQPSDAGWGRERRPVIFVNWADTQTYIGRAGTNTFYFFVNSISATNANYDKQHGRTLPVGSFPPNAFGLYDMTGNVAQWVEDCYHDSYRGAPVDGKAWLTGDCSKRNVRGGAWSLHGWSVRIAQRIGDPADMRNDHLGFRVARDLR
jgi:formylglycine-generating enzyme required for sulfatase activity